MARGAAGGVCGLGKGRRRRASQPGVGGGGRRGGGDPGSEAERAGCGNIPRNPGHAEGAGRGSPCGPPASARARPRLPPKLREPRCSPRAAALHGEKGSAEAARSRSPPLRLPRPSSSPPGSRVLPPPSQCPSPSRPRPPATPPGRGARSPAQQTWSRLPGPWGETWVVGTGRASLSGSWNLGAARAAGLSGQWKKASWAWRVLGAWGEPACRSAWGEDCSGPGGPQCLGHRAAALGIRTWWSPRTDPWTGTLGAYLTF